MVKVGYAKVSIKSRMEDLQVGNPYRLFVWGWILTPNPIVLEAAVHNRLQDQHVRGEWFKVDARLSRLLALVSLNKQIPQEPFDCWLGVKTTDLAVPKRVVAPRNTIKRDIVLRPGGSYGSTSFLRVATDGLLRGNRLVGEWNRLGVIARNDAGKLSFYLLRPPRHNSKQQTIRSGAYFVEGRFGIQMQCTKDAENLWRSFKRSMGEEA